MIGRRVTLALMLVGACDKSGSSASGTVAAGAKQDRIDEAKTVLLTRLAAKDYAALKKHTVNPLTHDLSEAEFTDLAAIVGWLGPLQGTTVTRSDRTYGGGQRWYELQFENGGVVELEVSIDADGKLVGFAFGGEGFEEAERGVIAEPWREFKVYDFVFLDAEGTPLPGGTPIPGERVDYELVVGGIEAFIGEHHLSIEKIVFDAGGKEVFHEPIEFDAKFAADASGIPRGVVRGHLEVPGPGTWEMDLKITDQHSQRQTDHRLKFETVAAP
jgi:hypothetical protein